MRSTRSSLAIIMLVKRLTQQFQKEFRLIKGAVDLIHHPPVLTFDDQIIRFLEEQYQSASCIVEFGSGGSTRLAAQLGGKTLRSIETDRLWAYCLNKSLRKNYPGQDVEVLRGDIGWTKEWGHPRRLKESNLQKYKNYCHLPWTQNPSIDPDLILIDGRFRVACFLVALKSIRKKTRIVFDDYGDRKWYHVVERIVSPPKMIGRMAVFDVDPSNDSAEIDQMLKRYYRIPK